MAPSLTLFITLFVIFAGISSFKGLHCVGNSSVFLSILTFLDIFIRNLFYSLFGLWISVHKEINDDIPRLIAWNITSELKDLTSEEPEAISDRVLALVVCWNGNIDIIKR